MPVTVAGQSYDSMKEACQRVGISRQTLLRYIADGFFTPPPRHKQGKNKTVRYFTEEWYAVNEAVLREARDGPAPPAPEPDSTEKPPTS